MKTKIILFIALMTMTLSFAQTSKAEINRIIKKQSDGIITPSQKGVSTIYNDGTSVVKTVYNDAKLLSPKIESAIKSLATELKTTSTALWVILVRQQLVWSICFLILTIASLINWFIFYRKQVNPIKLSNKIGKRSIKIYIPNPDFNQEYYDDNKKYLNSDYSSERNKTKNVEFMREIISDGEEEFLIPLNNTSQFPAFKYIHLIICILLSGLSIYHFSDMLTGFINPEFGALKTIVEVATKLK